MSRITWSVERRKVAELVPAEYNPRKLTPKQKEDLTKSVDRFGQVEPVVVNTNGVVIGGHSRLKVYADLGMDETDVMVPSKKLTKAEEQELNLRLNKNVGEWDWDKLKEFFEIDGLKFAGFEEDELRVNLGLVDAADADVDEDRMLVLTVLPPETPKLKERAVLRFVDMKEYLKVKKAVLDGKIQAEDLLKLL